MTATEVSRNFSAVLNAVEHGETITITRGNRRVATMSPSPPSNGKEFKEFMATWRGKLDDDWAADIEEGMKYIKEEEIRDPWED